MPTRQRRYHWQGEDQLLSITDSQTGPAHFTYDDWGNLASAVYANGAQELRRPDAVGNLFRTLDRSDRRYGAGGQLREACGTRYLYDEEGNLTQKTTPDGQAWRYAWDSAGQLAAVTRPDGYAVTFTYDAFGRRVSKRFRGKVTRWVWDGDQPLHEWHELEVGSNAGAAQDLTTWLFEDGCFVPLAKLTQASAYNVVCDHLGTPLGMYNSQGQPCWEASLDSYGAVREGRGRPQDCPFRYQGQYEDPETGLYYNRFRYYDPEAGQYISQDPIRIEGGLDLYGYAPNPAFWGDPFGLSKTPTSTLRRVWTQYTGTKSTAQLHHGLPEQMAGDFKQLGNIKVNNGKYFFDLTPEKHILLPNGVHTKGSPLGQEWNAHWRQWLANNRPTLETSSKRQARRMIEQHLDDIAEKAGIAGDRAVQRIKGPCPP